MSDSYSQGKTTVSPDVLITIARLSALSVSGVSRMAQVPGGVNRLFKRGAHEGVRIQVEDNTVFASLYLILKKDVNIREVSRNVQHQVARALQEMVSMDIGGIEIHIEDIDYEETEAAPA
ncbi:MAG TPA: Asp23/Gls24 family envelope stress response protein [Anaerolineales bacterium]|nr:Asp23/Gls24 family envelope stress response protein [Anaerolineales bacterium]